MLDECPRNAPAGDACPMWVQRYIEVGDQTHRLDLQSLQQMLKFAPWPLNQGCQLIVPRWWHGEEGCCRAVGGSAQRDSRLAKTSQVELGVEVVILAPGRSDIES